MATKKKTFDALAASRRWRRKTSRLMRGMTPDERMEFFNGQPGNPPAEIVRRPPLELVHR